MGMHLTVKEKGNLKKELILQKEQCETSCAQSSCVLVTAQTSDSHLFGECLLKLSFLQFEGRSLGSWRHAGHATKILIPVNIAWNKYSSQELFKGDVLSESFDFSKLMKSKLLEMSSLGIFTINMGLDKCPHTHQPNIFISKLFTAFTALNINASSSVLTWVLGSVENLEYLLLIDGIGGYFHCSGFVICCVRNC